ncbi:hypothetical protein, partial [Nocardioides sp.]|uniref:hypothetical protein n=1 Tax=Nocardioides sp. TaxID=35761 RepID=UPI002D7E43D9
MLRTTSVPAAALLCVLAGGCTPGTGEERTGAGRSGTPTPTAAPSSSPEALTGNGTADLPPQLARALRGQPAEARSAGHVVDQIVAAERAIADPRTTPDVLAAAGHLQQVAYRELGARPGWDDRVRAALPRDLLRVVRDNVASRRAFRSMHPQSRSELSDELPA